MAAGKTTAFNMISGIYAPTSGNILFKDQKINGLRPDQVAGPGHCENIPEHPAV